MIKIKKSYNENRRMHPEVYSKYASHASMAKPNDPIYLDTQSMFKIVKTDNKVPYFAAITVKPRLRIWCPLKTKQSIDGDICDSKLLKRDGHYELHLTISKQISFDNTHPSSILSVDMGEKAIATAVLFADDPFRTSNQSTPVFLGRNVRGLRRRYAYLRKKLGEKKLMKMIRKVGSAEQRKVNDILHKISRQIANMAKQNNAVILLGDLTGIRDRSRGRRMNRIVANMPFYRLTQYITYKANWEGIPVLTTKEWYSSKLCHKCGSDNTSRPHQGLFVCHACGYSCNADYNGASNLAKRLANYMFVSGTVGFQCENRTTFYDSISQVNNHRRLDRTFD
jgi:IS605 OrfB family transposase